MERGWRVKIKWLCIVFWLTRRSRVRRKNAFWGILKHEQQVIAYFQTHYDYRPQKMPLTLAGYNLQIHGHCLPLWRKYAQEVKAAKGLKWCRKKVKGVNNPTWIAQQYDRHTGKSSNVQTNPTVWQTHWEKFKMCRQILQYDRHTGKSSKCADKSYCMTDTCHAELKVSLPFSF